MQRRSLTRADPTLATAKMFCGSNSAERKASLRNPGGYCGLGGTGVSCPVGLTPGAR